MVLLYLQISMIFQSKKMLKKGRQQPHREKERRRNTPINNYELDCLFIVSVRNRSYLKLLSVNGFLDDK